METKHTQGEGTLVWTHAAEYSGTGSGGQARRVYFTGHDSKLAGRYQVLHESGCTFICETDTELLEEYPYAHEAIKKATV